MVYDERIKIKSPLTVIINHYETANQRKYAARASVEIGGC